MIQAARSGKQNIVEGCAASPTSRGTEIKLINVAKASLQELLVDYEDYLRTNGHPQWELDSVEMRKMRELGREHNDSPFFMEIVKRRPLRAQGCALPAGEGLRSGQCFCRCGQKYLRKHSRNFSVER